MMVLHNNQSTLNLVKAVNENNKGAINDLVRLLEIGHIRVESLPKETTEVLLDEQFIPLPPKVKKGLKNHHELMTYDFRINSIKRIISSALQENEVALSDLVELLQSRFLLDEGPFEPTIAHVP